MFEVEIREPPCTGGNSITEVGAPPLTASPSPAQKKLGTYLLLSA